MGTSSTMVHSRTSQSRRISTLTTGQQIWSTYLVLPMGSSGTMASCEDQTRSMRYKLLHSHVSGVLLGLLRTTLKCNVQLRATVGMIGIVASRADPALGTSTPERTRRLGANGDPWLGPWAVTLRIRLPRQTTRSSGCIMQTSIATA